MLPFLYFLGDKLFVWLGQKARRAAVRGLSFILRKKRLFCALALALTSFPSLAACPPECNNSTLTDTQKELTAPESGSSTSTETVARQQKRQKMIAEQQAKKDKKWLKNVYSVDKSCLDRLEKSYLYGSEFTDQDETKTQTKTQLSSLKEACEKHKEEAERCCANPKHCAGLALDLAKGIGPLLPSFYAAFRGYQISKDASDSKITREQAMEKMCSAQNIMQAGSFGSQLLSQLAPLAESSCEDDIGSCQSNCNIEIDRFKNDFKNCFFNLTKGGEAAAAQPFAKNIDALLDWAELCSKEIKEISDIRLAADVVQKFDESSKLIIGTREGSDICQDYQAENFVPKTFLVNKRTMGYIWLFAEAYKNSAIEGKKYKLSERSNEKEIVNCEDQPNRAVSSRYTPGGPVSPPMIQVCRQAVAAALDNPPTPPQLPQHQPAPNSHSLLAGTDSDSKSQLIPDNPDEYGIVTDPDDDAETNNAPPLIAKGNLPSRGAPSGGDSPGSGGPGGLGPGGGGGPYGDEDDEGSGYPYSSSLAGLSPDFTDSGLAGSFAGGFPSDGLGGEGGAYPYREPGSEGGTDFDSSDGPNGDSEGFDPDSGGSIFQLASQRIKQFCSDNSCAR